jgi:galactonate dehydratase
VKFSAPPAPTECQRIRVLTDILAAIRKSVGDRLDIGLEFGESFTTRTAIRMSHTLEPYHPLFTEESLPRENSPSAFGELAAESPGPVATGK